MVRVRRGVCIVRARGRGDGIIKILLNKIYTELI
jgi:hypothetical protein